MRLGKDVPCLLPALLAALACAGCVNGPGGATVERGVAATSPARPQAVRTAPLAPTLRIAEPPPAAATALVAQPPVPPPPEGPAHTPPAPAESKLRRLHRLAAEEYAGIDSYIVRVTRREQVNGKAHPQEIIRFTFRKEPWSVHFVWLDGDGKGREVVYVKGRYENKIHTLVGPGDSLLMRAGSRIALAPDSPLVRSASRYPITDAGIGGVIDRFGALLEANEKGDKRRGTLTYVGPQKRPEYEAPLEAAEQVIPPGANKDLPRGGRRWWMFDPVRHLPVLIILYDDRGQEVEYYCHDRFQYPVKLDDDDFNPDKLWGKR
jgi:hypothetical protein